MDTESWIGLGLLALSLIFIEFSVVAEVAVAASPRLVRHNGAPSSPLTWVAARRDILHFTVLTLKTTAIISTSGLISMLLFRTYGMGWETLIAVVVFSVLAIVILQAIPSSLANINPERALRVVSAPLRVVDLLLWPFTLAFSGLTALAVAVAPKRRPQELTPAEEELQAIVEEIGELSEPLEEQERDMIRRIIGLESTTVREIMVPRPDIIAAEADAPLSTGIDLIVKYGVSRIPIYEDTVDEVVGVVYAKDLLRATHQADAPATLRALARKPHFVPESKKIDELLKELRENHIHMAIVVDEYGGTAGLVSLEDLLEEIVGEIEDEYDRGEVSVQRISPHEAVLDARVSIADLNELFGTAITQEDFATIGGLVYAELGKIPAVGDEIRVDGLTITVLATSGRRIRKVRAVLSDPSEDPED